MANVSKVIFCTLVSLFIAFGAFSQSSKKLKLQQQQLEQKINATKNLLGASKSSQKLAVDEMAVLQSRINLRQELLLNINQQLSKLENEIRTNKASINALDEKVVKLKEQFKKLVRAAYKYRNKYDNIIYVFSADDFNEANKRMKYVEKLKDYRIKQIASIKRSQEDLTTLNKLLEEKKQEQLKLIGTQNASRKDIIADQELKRKAYQELKGEESNLLAELRKAEAKKADLDNAIAAALKKELELELEKARKVEKARRKKELELAEKNRLAKIAADKKKAAAAKASGKPEVKVVKPVVKPIKKETDFSITKEVALTGASFASNKGKLPWPVAKGTVTKKFGKHAHPVHVGVYTNNNGVDIATSKGSNVRSIYKGKVTSVLVIPGAGKVIIIAHGNYRTVFTNLQEVYVKKGDNVSIKQKIGSLLPTTSGKTSTAHFEIHVIKDGSVSKLNPSLWIAK